jgi:6-phosphogluconolactonase (cycloisomerase 2 family)
MRKSFGGRSWVAALLLGLGSAAPAHAIVEAGPIANPTNGNDYYLLSINTWASAAAEAALLGGHLVAIGDPVENDWVWSTFAGITSGPFWIGLGDAAAEGYFAWTNGEPYGYTSWWTAGGEPNDAGGVEDWAELHNGVWNDTNGFGPNAAVVEVEDEPGFAFVEAVPIPLPPVEPYTARVTSLVVSPDGHHVYGLYGIAIGADLVLVYERGADGTLSLVDSPVVAGNPTAMAMTSDGSTLFVVSNNGDVQAWQRAPATGLLTLLDHLYDGQRGADLLRFARDVAVSPDGANVHVVSGEHAVTTFSWNGAVLALVDTEISGSEGLSLPAPDLVAVTPDGRFVLAVSSQDAALVAFARDPATGVLTFSERFVDNANGVDGLYVPQDILATATSGSESAVYVSGVLDGEIARFAEGPELGSFDVDFADASPIAFSGQSMATSPDGTQLYATDGLRSGLNAYARDPQTGALGGVAESVFATDAGVDGLQGPVVVAASPDGRNVYVSTATDQTIAVFATPEPGSLALGLAALLAVARRYIAGTV